MNEYGNVLSSQSLKGAPVVDSQDREVGRLEELMIDMESGAIVYGIFSFGALLANDKHVAIPWSALRVTNKVKQVVVKIRRDKLRP